MDFYGTSIHMFCCTGQNGCSKESAENLHGNKSYNLSPVCTLDWLKAITMTKKAFPPSFLFLLPALCQINPLNFLKDLCLFFSCLRMKTLSVLVSILLFCRYGTWKRRLLSEWNSCQEFPVSPSVFSLFVLPDPSLVSQLHWRKDGELSEGLILSRWDPCRCWVMGGWGPSRGRRWRGGVKWIKQRKNGVLFDNQRMWWG